MTSSNRTTSKTNDQRVVLVTGPSGAGRSTAIKVLEDVGYEAIDNLPLSLLPRLLDGPPIGHPLALGIDVRNRDFSTAALIEMIETLSRTEGLKVELLYLDCSTDVLVRRYSETRRRHPLAPAKSPIQGIEKEIDLLVPIRARADVLLDTSTMSPHDLRAEVERWFASETGQRLAVSVHSFSYKRGVPRGVDMIFDCRFLKNPHWEESLRSFDGRNKEVADYIATDPRYDAFFGKVQDLINMLLPAYIEEGKAHLSIGFGCTGGQHRSVAVAEKLVNALAQDGWQVSIRHREMERKARNGSASSRGDKS
ncbi:MAG TPA: RNase adapter RapZ [Rhodobacteraceae bacterium]|nr:RNase adapter RapZ [Paracoccaceae bacterium]